jgi:8-oxo-dGTP diphosphatase
MIEYVLGFYFDSTDLECPSVALIKKDHPPWQAGLLNGVGGKVKSGETLQEAMAREFKEEAGIEIYNWNYFASIKGQDYYLYCYVASGDAYGSQAPKTAEREIVEMYDLDAIKYRKIIPNVLWLIHMGLMYLRGNYSANLSYYISGGPL